MTYSVLPCGLALRLAGKRAARRGGLPARRLWRTTIGGLEAPRDDSREHLRDAALSAHPASGAGVQRAAALQARWSAPPAVVMTAAVTVVMTAVTAVVMTVVMTVVLMTVAAGQPAAFPAAPPATRQCVRRGTSAPDGRARR